MLQGIGVSSGIGSAPALHYSAGVLQISQAPAEDRAEEVRRFQAACCRVKEKLTLSSVQALETVSKESAEIFQAHVELLEDEDSILDPIEALIREGGKNAAAATAQQFDELIEMMRAVPDPYMRQRTDDFLDLKDQILREILRCPKIDLSHLPSSVILVAEQLAPSDTIHMDLEHIAGFICSEGSKTSHTAILARSMGIPAVVGCPDAFPQLREGTLVLLDGATGEIVANPSPEETRRFALRAECLAAERLELESYQHCVAQTRDGFKAFVLANVAAPDEVAVAVESGADGVGLLRSEFLYMNRTALPTEEEQFECYRKALTLAEGRPVTIRTLDAGGDKELSSLGLEPEENPFLGYRAIRICLDRPDLFRTQLRALYRASVYGTLKIMFPMISSLEELRRAKAIAKEVRDELRTAQISFDEAVPLGIMVEVPAVAVTAEWFAREADFFSIGTNDLIQYTVAVDRGNEKIEALYTAYHPAVIRLVAHTVQAAQEAGIECCMCGEAASDLHYIPILLGLGLDHFSMAAPCIPKAKKTVCDLTRYEAERLSRKVCALKTADEIQSAQL